MSEMSAETAFRALGDPTRLQILRFVASECCRVAAIDEDGQVEGPTAGEVCCHVTGADRITSTVSHHIHELRDAGLIRVERRGRFMVCCLEAGRVRELGESLIKLANGETNGCC